MFQFDCLVVRKMIFIFSVISFIMGRVDCSEDVINAQANAIIDWYYKPKHDESLYVAFQAIDESIREKVLEKIKESQAGKDIDKELAAYSQGVPSWVRDKYWYKEGDLNSYLAAIKNLVELKAEKRAALQQEEQAKKRKRWFWQRWFGWR